MTAIEALRKTIEQAGYRMVDESHYRDIALWESWYKGKVRSFHDYTIYNQGRRIRKRRASLNAAKMGCEFWANLLWNTESYVNIDDEQADAAVNAVLRKNDFWRQTNVLTERAFALGTGAFVAFPSTGGTVIDYVAAPHIFPISWRNDTVESCAFAAEYRQKGEKLLYMMIHEKQPEGGYRIYNKFFRTAGPQLREVPAPLGIEPEYEAAVPRFALVKPNIANNAGDVPLGISVYANCIDTLKSIDLAYDGAMVSMELGRPRIGVTSNGFAIDVRDGTPHPVFDATDIAVYDMGQGGDERVQVEDLTVQYRAADFEQSLQNHLNVYSQLIGLGDRAFRWQGSNVATATQIISENSSIQRAMEKHQAGLKSAITQLARAILDIEGLDTTLGVTVMFDDSVTRDREAERERFWRFVEAGHFPFWRYLVEFEGYTEDEARGISAMPAQPS